MSQQLTTRRRPKVSVTVDPDLLRMVDAYVDEHPGSDRSRIFDEGLLLWYAKVQERAMEEQYAQEPTEVEREEIAAWKRIQAEAAKHIFRPDRD